MAVVLRIIGTADGFVSGFDGQFLVEYDPDRTGYDRLLQQSMTAFLRTTRDPRDARHYPDARAAMEEWRRVSKRDPIRIDGKPNRPLTAFTAEVLPLQEAIERYTPDA